MTERVKIDLNDLRRQRDATGFKIMGYLLLFAFTLSGLIVLVGH